MMCWLIIDSNRVGTSIQGDGDIGKIGANSAVMKQMRDSVDLEGEPLEA